MTQPRLLGGRYELDGIVGRGGMAEVYRARDLRLDRVVAVKTLREDLARDQTFQARFRREAQSAASLNHPSIVAVYDTGEDNAGMSHVPFIVMEFVDGRTIRDLLRDDRRLLPERALEITDGVLRALDYSHRAGIVHRDIKPGNVMLNRQGEIKVMDFGIARAVADTQATMTQTAQVIGTAQYLSPEQARGERVDARSDLYSVGCLLYELLTGRPPFTGDSPVSIAYQHVREAPIPPSRVDPELPPWADPIVLRAMEKDPAERYQSAAEMRSDIQRALSGFPVAAGMPMTANYAHPGAGTRRMDPMGQTQLQGQTGGLPPYEYGPPETGVRPRRKKKVWPWVAVVLALAVIGGAIAAFELVSSTGSSVAVPSDLVGKKIPVAKAELRHAQLKATVISQKSLNGPYNKVTKTSPSAGTKVAEGSTVTLYYNVRPGAQAIPSVEGLTVSEATAKLHKAGWKDVTTSATPVASLKYSSGGQVVSTNPPVGKTVPLTTQIVLNVSGKSTSVPALIGLTRNQATATLNQAGLVYQTSIEPGPPGTTPGTVWKSTPSSGKAVLVGGSVTIYVEPGTTSSPTPSPTSSSPSASPSPSSSATP
ncbi:MAG TPA: Stk1 family PASTA domain-containing Ser/Thr kinase [Streptosporangiaceae bacterium]|jgi:beta-lactam-binding protein with PASTA domain/tRNA A-37 threonylcarbamoyl transferase component Bud32|nr:Stk1 family PASTA domain-containing Ser/Thr kinase [Streptosporangiaceae bacterium]